MTNWCKQSDQIQILRTLRVCNRRRGRLKVTPEDKALVNTHVLRDTVLTWEVIGQREQEKGRTPRWLRTCLFREPCWLKRRSHWKEGWTGVGWRSGTFVGQQADGAPGGEQTLVVLVWFPASLGSETTPANPASRVTSAPGLLWSVATHFLPSKLVFVSNCASDITSFHASSSLFRNLFRKVAFWLHALATSESEGLAPMSGSKIWSVVPVAKCCLRGL